MAKLPKHVEDRIDECVKHYDEHRLLFEGFARSVQDSLRADPELAKYIHFIKYRLKSLKRLRQKLCKKHLKGEKPVITTENLFQEINDLAGVRILHLHMDQIGVMTGHIKR